MGYIPNGTERKAPSLPLPLLSISHANGRTTHIPISRKGEEEEYIQRRFFFRFIPPFLTWDDVCAVLSVPARRRPSNEIEKGKKYATGILNYRRRCHFFFFFFFFLRFWESAVSLSGLRSSSAKGINKMFSPAFCIRETRRGGSEMHRAKEEKKARYTRSTFRDEIGFFYTAVSNFRAPRFFCSGGKKNRGKLKYSLKKKKKKKDIV